MNTQNVQAEYFPARHVRQCARGAIAAAFLAVGLLLPGCGSKDGGAAAPVAGQAVQAAGGSVQATPQQEAARQRAIEEGPAIQAANDPNLNKPVK